MLRCVLDTMNNVAAAKAIMTSPLISSHIRVDFAISPPAFNDANPSGKVPPIQISALGLCIRLLLR
jgi:hypothetical protein